VKFTTLKFKMQLSLNATVMALLLALVMAGGCSEVSDKGSIPPDHPVQKVRDSDEHTVFNQQVDILFVVDDSGSMEAHQANLSANIKLFTAELGKTQFVDYHVGVVTTSMDNQDPNTPWNPSFPWGTLPCDNTQVGPSRARACGDGRLVRYKTKIPFIDRNTPGGLQALEDNVIVGTNGSGEEHSFDPVAAALTAPFENTVNAGFLRPAASLAIIFVTDSEDQSSAMTAKSLHDFLVQLKGQPDKVLAYGALVPTSVADPACSRDDGFSTPVKIESFIAMFKGLEYNICDVDFGTKLATIAKDVVQKVGKALYLSRTPVVSTIAVTYGSQVIPNDPDYGWTYDPVNNALNFGDKLVYSNQPSGTQIEVNFTAGTY
jgi:hypothetical protein